MEAKKKKKYFTPKITSIRVKNAADFLKKSDEEIIQFLKEKGVTLKSTQEKSTNER